MLPLAFAMRLARRFLFCIVLIAYAVQVLGGMGLHSLFCAAESCASCEAPDSLHSHGHCGSHRHDDHDEQPTPCESEHNPDECPVCQVLGIVVVASTHVEI